jgi:predicted porin
VVVGKSSLYYSDTLAMPYLGIPGAGEGYRVWDVNGLTTFNLLSQVGNNYGAIATLGNTRSQNVVRYDSPKFGNMDASVAYTPNASGDEPHIGSCTAATPCSSSYSSGATLYGRIRYNDGPLNASFSVLSQKVAGGIYTAAAYSGPLNTTAYRAGVAYTLPMGLRAGLVYDSTEIENGIGGTTQSAKRDVLSVPVSFAWDKHQIHATYTRAGSTSNIDSSGATQLNLGYDYALSRTTFIGAYYTRLTNDSNGRYTPFLTGTSFGGDAPAKGEGWNQLSFDVNYWF